MGKPYNNSTLDLFNQEALFFLLSGGTGQTNNITGKYIMEPSKLKHLQLYMTTFELEYRKFERNSQRQKPSTKFHFTIEDVFETLETSDVDMSTSHYMIDPIVNGNFVNTFHRQNVPDQIQHFHKQTGKN